MTFGVAVARLACILAGVGLATTRIGLVLHELVGHGAVAMAHGARILDVRLFWFAGGWIRYDLPEPRSLTAMLVISLGGIALELVLGLAMWLAIRRQTLGGKILRATGAAIAIHGAWYLAIGTFHGFGDGAIVRYALGDSRVVVALFAGAAMLVMCFLAARGILGAFAATIPGGRGAKIGGLVAATALAGGLQAGLAIGEVRLRVDTTYGTIMQTEDQRVVAREMARWELEQRERGAAIDAEVRRLRERALVEQHREFPFAIVLGVLTFLAIVAGGIVSRPGREDTVPPRLVLTAVVAAVGSVALVIALDTLFV